MPCVGEEAAGQVHVFGRHAHLAVVARAKGGGDIVEVGHAAHVDPGLRHRHHHIGEAEADAVQQHHALLRVGDHLAHQIFAGDAEMRRALCELRGDIRRGKIGDFHIVEAGDAAAVFPRAARLDEAETGAREKGFGVFLQAAFRRHRKDKRTAHAALPLPASRSIQTAKPTAGIGTGAPSRVSSPS